jgi:hypothetical protein
VITHKSVLKIRNELGKKRTFLALGGSVTRRWFTEPARAAVVFIGRGAAAGMGGCPENTQRIAKETNHPCSGRVRDPPPVHGTGASSGGFHAPWRRARHGRLSCKSCAQLEMCAASTVQTQDFHAPWRRARHEHLS